MPSSYSSYGSEERTGAQLLCETLLLNGVDVMFGIPGGTVMPFYHAMFEYRDRLRHILCRHEQGAGHAAEGYARATGRIGVCIGTSGPGSTNLVTAIADAWLDSTPILAITGQVMGALIGTDAFQETDITGITIPITKHNYLVRRTEDIPRIVTEAICLALDGRTGPVHVDITKDAQQGRSVVDMNVVASIREEWKQKRQVRLTVSEEKTDQFNEAVDLLAHAKKPLIISGNGVIMSESSEELLKFAESLDVPVVTTLHGLGSFPQDHRLSMGMPGMHGWVHVNKAIQECDVLLGIGVRFEDRVTGKASTFAPNAKIIHIDIDKSELNKLVEATIAIQCDAAVALKQLLTCACKKKNSNNDEPLFDQNARTIWHSKIAAMKELYLPRQSYTSRERNSILMPHDVYDGINRLLADRKNIRVVTDVGQHQMWAAQLLEWYRPRTHITSGGAGTMGFAVPAALGIATAHPNDTVLVICGDGGFQMTNQELATMKQEKISNVKIALINNGYLGMVRQWQELFEEKVYSNTPLANPDFIKMAEAYGALGLKIESADQVEFALHTALEYDGVVLMDFRVEQEANVFPIVPQGSSIGAMMVGNGNRLSDDEC